MTYTMNHKTEFRYPTERYLNVVKQGYKDCGLDKSYLVRALCSIKWMYTKLNTFLKGSSEVLPLMIPVLPFGIIFGAIGISLIFSNFACKKGIFTVNDGRSGKFSVQLGFLWSPPILRAKETFSLSIIEGVTYFWCN